MTICIFEHPEHGKLTFVYEGNKLPFAALAAVLGVTEEEASKTKIERITCVKTPSATGSQVRDLMRAALREARADAGLDA